MYNKKDQNHNRQVEERKKEKQNKQTKPKGQGMSHHHSSIPHSTIAYNRRRKRIKKRTVSTTWQEKGGREREREREGWREGECYISVVVRCRSTTMLHIHCYQ